MNSLRGSPEYAYIEAVVARNINGKIAKKKHFVSHPTPLYADTVHVCTEYTCTARLYCHNSAGTATIISHFDGARVGVPVVRHFAQR